MFRPHVHMTRPVGKLAAISALALSAFIATSCASSQASSDHPTTPVRTVVKTKVVHETTAPTNSAEPTHAERKKDSGTGNDYFTMPNEVGQNLQDAQNQIQRVSGNPIFFSHSTDATGQGRHQILDRDWKVCSQNVKPGARVNLDSYISFAAVKTDESCP